jgi:hypothetical protein
MEKKTKILLTILIVTILVIAAGTFAYVWLNGISTCCDDTDYPSIYCIQDSTNKTLRITGIENAPNYFNWSDIEVTLGNATLPTGTIDVGDIITNCSGTVVLVYEPYYVALSSWTFN